MLGSERIIVSRSYLYLSRVPISLRHFLSRASAQMETRSKWVALLLTVVVAGQLPAASRAEWFGNVYCTGGSDVAVHLFEWPWDDIANACPQLAAWGYCAVQVSPPQEHIQGSQWWTRYQPVSYILQGRSGHRDQFRSMIETCNNVGVRIYADAVINHMTGGGYGTGTAGSSWSGDNQDYPSVPFSDWDFNGPNECSTPSLEIDNYHDIYQVRNCRLVGLRDLKLSKDYVRDTVRGYMNDLIGLGVAGFRVDASKHMWPGDMSVVFNGLNDLSTQFFPGGTRPLIYMEVIDQGGEPITAGEYTPMGRVTEFKYGMKLGEAVLGKNGQSLSVLQSFGEAWGFINGMDALSFVDNHDNQRGHGGGGDIITFHDPYNYKIANAFMLAWNYGYVRIMSSYEFSDGDQGPPSGGVTCFNGQWICEHAWRQIHNMVGFHNAAVGQPVTNWWDNGYNAIAFSRGNNGFLLINKESYGINQWFNTGLPSGEYCDVISCDNNRPPCGNSGGACRAPIHVNGDGWAEISLNPGSDPVVAIHV